MEKVWTEDGKRESMPASLLSLYNGGRLSSSETSMFWVLSVEFFFINFSVDCKQLLVLILSGYGDYCRFKDVPTTAPS